LKKVWNSERQALVVLASHLVGGGELALGPVAHDLHAGLAVDDHASGTVPFAPGRVGVDVVAQLLQCGEGLNHLVAGQGVVI